MNPIRIKEVFGREVLDSRGYPTVEAEIAVEGPHGLLRERAIVPSGASTGEGEALELRDGDPKRYNGKGVLKAVKNIREKIAPALLGKEFARQALLDDLLCELDGTPTKSKLGANAILSVSMAFCRAHARASHLSLSEYLADAYGSKGVTLPVPLMNILNGGKHADNGLNIQEFMIVPVGFDRFSEALRAGAEIFHALKKALHSKHLSTGIGDEGGFAPVLNGSKPHEQAIGLILQAISDAGYREGKEIFLALDCASSEFAQKDSMGKTYYQFEGQRKTAQDMIQLYESWAETYPILSIEDGLAENDWAGWIELTTRLGTHCQLVGDDLFVTNVSYLKKGIEQKVANSILIKLNQIGTVTETLQTMKLAKASGYTSIASHRSGESEDTFIADLAVATDCGQIKTGSLCRTDRTAKYNQLLRLEETLGNRAKFAGPSTFQTE